jgi:hypothetical protein
MQSLILTLALLAGMAGAIGAGFAPGGPVHVNDGGTPQPPRPLNDGGTPQPPRP